MKRFVYFVIKSLSRGLASLPLGIQFFLGDALGILWFDIFRIRRRTSLENLKLCFPDWSEAERVRVARASVCSLGRSFIEFFRIPALSSSSEYRELWKSHFHIEGVEHLNAALKKGKGVFLLTAHIGSGDWATAGLALNGIQLHIISKEFKLQWLNNFWFETRSNLGSKFIPDRGSSLTILKQLKKNSIIVFMLDQFMGPPIGIKTKFFGHETGTPLGLALLTSRSEAAVVPIYTYRRPDGSTSVVFEPEIAFVASEDREESLQKMTQAYCDRIETWVRVYPEQWMWVHRRWKKYKY